jgi:hypothetical protein
MKAKPFRANLAWTQSKHSDVLLRLSEGLLGEWFPLHENPPDDVFHYTTTDGLIGIIESGVLWATHSAYLNDPSEIVHAHSLIQQTLDERLNTEEDLVGRELLTRARYAINPRDGMYQYFVVSFCEQSDLLGQWRAYSRRGGGYAMGFDAGVIKGLADPSPSVILRRVIYDHDLQRKFIAATIDRSVEKLKLTVRQESNEREVNGTIATFVGFLRDHFSEFHFTFKNLAFKEEQEWRLIVQADFTARDELLRDIKFRSASGVAVPYLALPLTTAADPAAMQLPLQSVVYGPTVESGRAEHGVRMLLDKYGYTYVTISSSQVPLRP